MSAFLHAAMRTCCLSVAMRACVRPCVRVKKIERKTETDRQIDKTDRQTWKQSTKNHGPHQNNLKHLTNRAGKMDKECAPYVFLAQ